MYILLTSCYDTNRDYQHKLEQIEGSMDQDTAIEIALKALYEQVGKLEDDEIVVAHIEETEEGWYIECNSRIFLETDDPMYALVTAPIIVYHDGSYRFIF
jgi:20S proteasome alpha/beta subunit